MSASSIEWTEYTWPVTRGCERISPGCEHCYAEKIAGRFCEPTAKMPNPVFAGFATRVDGVARWTRKVSPLPENLSDPLRWREPKMVFCNSMSDLFHKDVPVDYIHAVFAVMGARSANTMQVLTKRSERMRDVVNAMTPMDCYNAALKYLPKSLHSVMENVLVAPWPFRNVWLGVSVENQPYADIRIPHLMETQAAIRFLSCEPLLGPIKLRGHLLKPALMAECMCGHGHGFTRCPNTGGVAFKCHHEWCECKGFERRAYGDGLHWLISGAESGPGARPMHEDWVRSLRDQSAAAGVRFFYKQRLNERGHKVSLPILDGVQHAAFPETHHGKDPSSTSRKA